MSELPIKTFTIPEYGIVVNVYNGGHGSITSELKHQFILLHEPSEVEPDREAIATADAIEAMILGHACAGMDIESKMYLAGLHSAVDACSNNL